MKIDPTDLIGRKFVRLHILEHVGGGRVAKEQMYKAVCDCGNIVLVSRNQLMSTHKGSCGCLRAETASKNRTRHGETVGGKLSTEWRTWASMKDRCFNSNHPAFHNYGGRGISVCDRWADSFTNFLEDMGRKPHKSYSLDRLDNNKGYSPDNCAWVSCKTQTRNTRVNRVVEHNGRRQCVTAWAEEYGVTRQLVFARMKQGWEFSKALTAPVNSTRSAPKISKMQVEGIRRMDAEGFSVADIAKKQQVGKTTVRRVLNKQGAHKQ